MEGGKENAMNAENLDIVKQIIDDFERGEAGRLRLGVSPALNTCYGRQNRRRSKGRGNYESRYESMMVF